MASAKSATATFNPKGQNIDSIQKAVAQVLGLAGCSHCGRLALLHIDFVSDPPPDLGGLGVIQFEKQGF